jgi:hypothetical protein
VRLGVGDDEAAPRVQVTAERLDAPMLVRGSSSDGEREVIVRGVVPGRWRVTVWFWSQFGATVKRTVEVGNSGDATLDLPVR